MNDARAGGDCCCHWTRMEWNVGSSTVSSSSTLARGVVNVVATEVVLTCHCLQTALGVGWCACHRHWRVVLSSSDIDAGLRKVIVAVTGVGWRLESLSPTLWSGIGPSAEGSRHCCWTMLKMGVAVVSDAPQKSSQRRCQMYAEGYMTAPAHP